MIRYILKLKAYLIALTLLNLYVLQLQASTTQTTQSLIIDASLTRPSPDQNWQTMHTKHFIIHAPKTEIKYAERIAKTAEKIHDKLTKRMQWIPKEKTHIVLIDTVDTSNGGATPLPRNTFEFYLHEPIDGDLKDHTEWFEIVFTHEYVHILHLDQNGGFSRTLRNFFGRTPGLGSFFTFPQLHAQSWLSEGLAVYEESKDGRGRGNSANYESMMRQEVEKGLLSYSEVSYEGRYGSRWPLGLNYLYGYYFFQFIKAEYDEETITRYIKQYNDNIIPFRMDTRADIVFGLGSEDLWKKYQKYLIKHFKPQIERIKNNISPRTIMDKSKYLYSYLTPMSDNQIIYLDTDFQTTSKIRQIDTQGNIKDILKLSSVVSIDYHPKQGLLIGRTSVCENYRLTTDLYQYDLKTKKLKRLTNCQRLLDARWMNNGEYILAVESKSGKSSLVQIDMQQLDKIKYLSKFELGDVIGHFDINSSDDQIIASIKRAKTGWNLENYNLTTQAWTTVTQNKRIEDFPRYLDDKTIVFISDMPNKQQIEAYSITLGDSKAQQLTQSLGYIRNVLPSDEGMWTVEYTNKREVLNFHKFTFEQSVQSSYEVKSEMNNLASIKKQTLKYQPYSALNTLKPLSWFPLYKITNDKDAFVGVQLQASDVLGFHTWQMNPLYYYNYNNSKTPFGGNAGYSYYNRLFLQVEKTFKNVHNAEDANKVESSSVNTQWQIQWKQPFNNKDYALETSIGVAYQDKKTISSTTGLQDTNVKIFAVNLSYNSLKAYTRNISYAEGSFFKIILDYDKYKTDEIDKTQTGNAITSLYSRYFHVGYKQSISLKGLIGKATDNSRKFELGGTDAENSLRLADPLGRRDYSLRGYKTNEILIGQNIARATIDYTFPIKTIYDGFNVVPLGIGQVSGKVFAESGDAWQKISSAKWYNSVGVEINTEVQLGFDALKIPFTFGLSKGFDDKIGDTIFYVNILSLG